MVLGVGDLAKRGLSSLLDACSCSGARLSIDDYEIMRFLVVEGVVVVHILIQQNVPFIVFIILSLSVIVAFLLVVDLLAELVEETVGLRVRKADHAQHRVPSLR